MSLVKYDPQEKGRLSQSVILLSVKIPLLTCVSIVHFAIAYPFSNLIPVKALLTNVEGTGSFLNSVT